MIRHRQGDELRIASLIHRISGVVLAVFLPFHFYVLGLALNDAAQLDGFLKWTELGIVKVAETGLVLLLALHLFGGLRLLAVEFLPWSPKQKTFAAGAVALSFFVSVGFFLSAV
ncbi:MAG: succinate dehydrogenase, cytochrome b556 subunit [Filomicrobium sp.]